MAETVGASPERRDVLDAVVVGAGPAGLAVSRCLLEHQIPHVVLERATCVGPSWRSHYERLHLHTVKQHSSLPYLEFGRDIPRYPSRIQFVDYLETYARPLDALIRFGEEVTNAAFHGGNWHITTSHMQFRARCLIVASGYCHDPIRPTFPGLERFKGSVVHSQRYKNGVPFANLNVLIVGLGNSGGEIAIDLWEHNASPFISVRSPVHVVPRDLFGFPAQLISISMAKLPRPVANALAWPLSRFFVGDLSSFGLHRPPMSPIDQVERLGRIPLVDVGTVDLIRKGAVRIVPEIEQFLEHEVIFRGGARRKIDAVILATGYRPGLEKWLENSDQVTDVRGYPRWHGKEAWIPGLFFIGFRNPITGSLREIHIESGRIADEIRRRTITAAQEG